MIKNFIFAFFIIGILSTIISNLEGCKTQQVTYLPLSTVIPGERYAIYKFSFGGNRLILIDTNGAYDFPDTIVLNKK